METKEKDYKKLVHFKADTYERPEYAEQHKLVCELMKEIRKHKFNTYGDNFRLFLNNPENKDLDVNYFRGMFFVGSIYLSRKKTVGKEISIGNIGISFNWRKNLSLYCSSSSPVNELLTCFTEERISFVNNERDALNKGDGEIKEPIDFIQHCLDTSNAMVVKLTEILQNK